MYILWWMGYFVDQVVLAQDMDCTELCTSHVWMSEYQGLHREPNEDVVKLMN